MKVSAIDYFRASGEWARAGFETVNGPRVKTLACLFVVLAAYAAGYLAPGRASAPVACVAAVAKPVLKPAKHRHSASN